MGNKTIFILRIVIMFYKLPLFLFGLKPRKKLILMDAARWIGKPCETISFWEVFELLNKNRNFATVYNYRFKDTRMLFYIKKIFFKQNNNIEINTPEIGGGLFIPHNFGCVISAVRIGENCQVDQGVTIGKGGARWGGGKPIINKPVIGNNVMITTNAIVIGDISIGDNAVIGAGSVITKSVPKNAVVVGNPQRILKYQGDQE